MQRLSLYFLPHSEQGWSAKQSQFTSCVSFSLPQHPQCSSSCCWSFEGPVASNTHAARACQPCCSAPVACPTLLSLARGASLMGLFLQGPAEPVLRCPALCRNRDRVTSGPLSSPTCILQDSPSGDCLLLLRTITTQWYC